jgi:hypothetical protein
MASKIIAVYNVKLTVRSDVTGDTGLTNDDVGEALANALAEEISGLVEGGLDEEQLQVNATSVERTDD